MGMFDTVHCAYPLPNRPHWADEFQTKDLDRTLAEYHITKAGEFRNEHGDIVPHDGTLNIYALDGANVNSARGAGWVEYDINFTNGAVDGVHLVSLDDRSDIRDMVRWARRQAEEPVTHRHVQPGTRRQSSSSDPRARRR